VPSTPAIAVAVVATINEFSKAVRMSELCAICTYQSNVNPLSGQTEIDDVLNEKTIITTIGA